MIELYRHNPYNRTQVMDEANSHIYTIDPVCIWCAETDQNAPIKALYFAEYTHVGPLCNTCENEVANMSHNN